MTAFVNPNVAQRHTSVSVPGAMEDSVLIGQSTTTNVGFYGTQPIAQPSISLGSGTLSQLITALGNLGLLNVTA